MEHVAIDLGGRESQICIRAEDGAIVSEARVATAKLAETLERSRSRVVMETCAEAFAIADVALELGHEVRVVPASLVRSLGVGARRTKTDRRDAQVLSDVSCRVDLPSVHVPSQWSREAKSLCGMRDVLVSSKTRLVNSVRGYLRQKLKRIPSGTAATLGARVRTRYAELGERVPPHLDRQLETIAHLHSAAKAATEGRCLGGEQPRLRPADDGAGGREDPLSVNVSETAIPTEFSVEGRAWTSR